MNGIELATELRRRHPQVKVLMLSMYDNREYVLSTIRAGARGYVLKESPTEDILAAINAVCAGGNYFSAQVASLVAQVGGGGPDAGKSENAGHDRHDQEDQGPFQNAHRFAPLLRDKTPHAGESSAGGTRGGGGERRCRQGQPRSRSKPHINQGIGK